MSARPEVSIILPTYNRADTIGRALRSVLAQHFDDWELIVVDDGSQDGTSEQLAGIDRRVRVLRQANAGVSAARNTGLAAARGRYIAFLDSDDAWQPHFLALTIGLLNATPEAHVVTTEFDQDFGDGHTLRLGLDNIRRYADFAQSMGSTNLALPPGEDDDYLRLYDIREPLGAWAAPTLARIGLDTAWHYHGHLFRHMRWGYLGWLPATVLTREALDHAGPFIPQLRGAEDYRLLGDVARRFRFHMIRVPSAIKHERAPGQARLKQGHLATGHHEVRFELDKMTQFKALFADQFDHDPELRTLLRHRALYTGRTALRAGLRQEALTHLREGTRWQPHLRHGYALLALALAVPSGAMAASLLNGWLRSSDAITRLLSGHLTLADVMRKVAALVSGDTCA